MKSSLIILPFEKLSWITLRQLSSTTGLCQCHYDILGVPRSATKNEIRKAYIKKSQEYHPDHIVNEKSSESKVQKAHDTFVKINEAYEILSSPKKRELYDLGLSRLGAEAIIKRHTKQGKKGKFVDLSQMTREERAAAMGYNVDPNFWSGETDRYLIAGACVVVIIVGFIIHYAIANISYQRHADELNRITKEINAHEKKVKDAAMEVIPGYDGNSSIRNFVMRMDNENGDALKKYEERRKKIAEARKAKALLLEEKTVVAGDQETQVN